MRRALEGPKIPAHRFWVVVRGPSKDYALLTCYEICLNVLYEYGLQMSSALQSLSLLRDGDPNGGGSGSSGDGVGGVLLPNAIVFKRLQQAAKRVRERLAAALERVNGEPAALDSDQFKVRARLVASPAGLHLQEKQYIVCPVA